MSVRAGARLLAALALVVLLALAGCGGATIKNDEVIKALDLTKPENSATYAVAGDPFCEIRSDLLSTSDEVVQAKANKRLSRLLVTNPNGTVGVIGVQPFGGSCKQQVVAGMQTVK